MMQKIALFSGLILSATCMVLHQQPIPLVGHQYDNQNYNFAYGVNDAYTGDIKNQHESKRGDTVLGQYSLLQPDGVRRTVDYRADDHSGFHASVNNEGRPTPQHATNGPLAHNNVHDGSAAGNLGQSYAWPSAAPSLAPTQSYIWPSASSNQASGQSYSWPAGTSSAASTPVAVSRTSIVQTISSHGHNPWV